MYTKYCVRVCGTTRVISHAHSLGGIDSVGGGAAGQRAVYGNLDIASRRRRFANNKTHTLARTPRTYTYTHTHALTKSIVRPDTATPRHRRRLRTASYPFRDICSPSQPRPPPPSVPMATRDNYFSAHDL